MARRAACDAAYDRHAACDTKPRTRHPSRRGTDAVPFEVAMPARVLILGTRGVPAAHGGFESFVERLAPFLVERGWRVTVYCQEDVGTVTERFATDTWRGVERVKVRVSQK